MSFVNIIQSDVLQEEERKRQAEIEKMPKSETERFRQRKYGLPLVLCCQISDPAHTVRKLVQGHHVITRQSKRKNEVPY